MSALFLEALQVALRGAAHRRPRRPDRRHGDARIGLRPQLRQCRTARASAASLRERVPGWQTIEIDPQRSTVFVPSGVELDFGATAKGLCADRAARAIGAATGAGVLVSLGGDISIGGPERGDGWVVLVSDDHASSPDAVERDALGSRIAVRSGGVATSGTTVRRWRRGETELHHVVDPRTGAPATEHWRTVSVAAASCVDANIASTNSLVMGADAPAWLEACKLPARLVSPEGTVVTVGGWPAEAEISC